MELDQLTNENIIPFEAILKVGDRFIGRIHGLCDHSKFTTTDMIEIETAGSQDLNVTEIITAVVIKMITSWDLKDKGEVCSTDILWGVPPQFVYDIFISIMKSFNREIPSCMKGLI